MLDQHLKLVSDILLFILLSNVIRRACIVIQTYTTMPEFTSQLACIRVVALDITILVFIKYVMIR